MDKKTKEKSIENIGKFPEKLVCLSPSGLGCSEEGVKKHPGGMFLRGNPRRGFPDTERSLTENFHICANKRFVLGVEVTVGNIHDRMAWGFNCFFP